LKSDRELLQVAGNICEGLDHIHQCGYLHGDIKSNNILIIRQNSNIVPQIIDFGKSSMISSLCCSCIIVKNEKEFENVKLKYPHMAKELFFGKPRTIETDIFAYGILPKEILNAMPNFN
jgi:serine/threonine protein kinase